MYLKDSICALHYSLFKKVTFTTQIFLNFSVTNIASNVELLVSDGWYCIKACLDKMLTKLVVDEKITIGCKIVTTGAELMNCEQGVAPWEVRMIS